MTQLQTRQTMRAYQSSSRSRRGGLRWTKLATTLAWVIVFIVGAVALLADGHAAQASSPGKGGRNHESEAALGAKHGEQRQSDCTLIVPKNPLSAGGLATPYQMKPTVRGGTNCDEATPAEAAFVQAAVLDLDTGQIAIYNPLVVDQGAKPAVAPVVPKLPAHAIVGIWFGANGTGLRLQGATTTTLASARCVDGLERSVFGQVAYCNASAFFSAANQLIRAKRLTLPALGVGQDGATCPTVRDFSVVDQDQSDNVTTSYRLTQDGKLAQDTAITAATLPGSTSVGNGSDNRLLAIALDAALGCAPWEAPDLANPGHLVTALPLDEIQAAMYQKAPVALVPSGDPMTLVNGQPSLAKQNLYRVGVDQRPETSVAQGRVDERAYCQNILRIAPARIQLDKPLTSAAASPDPAVANSLFTFLASRLSVTIGPDELNCTGLLHVPNPVQLTLDNGVAVDATFLTGAQPTATGA